MNNVGQTSTQIGLVYVSTCQLPDSGTSLARAISFKGKSNEKTAVAYAHSLRINMII